MRISALILTLIGLALALFSAWGMFTESGQRRFDEMDGLYPYFAGIAAIASFTVVGTMFAIAAWRTRKARPQ